MVCFDLEPSISAQVCTSLDNDVLLDRDIICVHYICIFVQVKLKRPLTSDLRVRLTVCAYLPDSADSRVGNAVWSRTRHIKGEWGRRVAENNNIWGISGSSDSSAWVWYWWWWGLFLNPLQVLLKEAEMAFGYHGDSAVETGQYDVNTLNCNTSHWIISPTGESCVQ